MLLNRRSFLEMGAGSVLGLGLADLLRGRALAHAGSGEKAVILLYLPGGLSHCESYDPKPDAPDVFRGPFGTIRTNVPGIHFGEMLPEQAKVADKMIVVRSLHHRVGDHTAAMHYWKTGYQGVSDSSRHARNPSVGAIVGHVKAGRQRDLPASVVLPYSAETTYDGPTYLGAAAQPLTVNVNYLTLTAVTGSFRLCPGVTVPRFQERGELLAQFNTARRDLDSRGQMAALDTFQRQASEMVLGNAVHRALDLNREDLRMRDRYGRTYFGQSVLLARRLVEAGVPCVTVNAGANVFDHHERIVPLLNETLPPVDLAVAALLSDLEQRGLLDQVLVCLLTDFGRDQMNNIAGRHHWPDCGSAVFAGGGLRGGQVVGASDRHGRFPTQTPLQPPDVLTMIYRHLDISLDLQFYDFSGRPIPINNGGRPIAQLVG
ncbi:unnamed protein product [uncultured bacterium]|nr:unnamed protein product [uncultured bacterium]